MPAQDVSTHARSVGRPPSAARRLFAHPSGARPSDAAPGVEAHYGAIALIPIRAPRCYRPAVASATKVLVIDDDPGIRQMLSLALGESGFEVVLSDGQRLEDAAGADVVLLDVRLGNRSARQLLAEVPSLANVPIIVMTATISAAAAAQGLPGIAAVVTKPFDLDVIEQTIREVVASGSSARP
jgi:CheY-like chemotaxis protein